MMAAKKKRKTTNPSGDADRAHVLRKILVVEYLVERLAANEFANLSASHAEQIAGHILTQFPFKDDKATDRLLQLLMSRIIKRADESRPPGDVPETTGWLN